MSLLARAVRGAFGERRDAFGNGSDPWRIPAPGDVTGLLASAGTAVSPESALSITTFYRGVQLLSNSISYLPLQAVAESPEGIRTVLKKRPAAITSPFVACSLQEGISQIIVSLVMRGNAYLAAVAWADRAREVVTQWRILSPDQVRVEFGPDGERRYKVNGNLWVWQMAHVVGFMLPGAVKGVGIIEHCRNSIGLGIALDDVAGEFFKNGAMSTGVIGISEALSQDEARAVAEQFRQNHSGVRRAHLPIVMSGNAKYTPMSLTPDDAQFIQSRQFQQAEVATLLGIPPHMLGIVDRTTSWGTGIEVQGRAFVDYTLRPYIEALQTMFGLWLDEGTCAEFDTDALTRADTETRYKNYQLALGANGGVGFMTVDEVRAMERLAPLPNGAGKRFYVSTLLAAVSDENGLIPPPAPPAPAAPAATDDGDESDDSDGEEPSSPQTQDPQE